MRERIVFLACLVLAFLLVACGASVEPTPTPTIEPTATFTLIPPTDTPEPTATNESTNTPVPISVFSCTFSECEEVFSEWMNTRFKYVYDVGEAKVYEGRMIDRGITVYLYDQEDILGNLMITVVENPLFNPDEQAMFLVQAWDYFGNEGVVDWFTKNWPKSSEQEIEIFEIRGRTLIVSTSVNEKGAFVFIMADAEYLP